MLPPRTVTRHLRCQAEVRRLREAMGRMRSSKLNLRVRGQILSLHLDKLRARITDPLGSLGLTGMLRLAEPSARWS